MISFRDAEEILKKEYHIDNFKYVVKELLLPDFTKDEHEVYFNNNLFASVTQLGTSEKCDVTVYEVVLKEGTQNRRVTITQEMFRILRGQGINNAMVAFANADYKNYRLSLLTSKYEFEGDKIVKILSNPRRYSYSLGYGTKTKTAYEFLISKGKVDSLEELIGRFSVEVVNKQFYNEIALAFTKLVGGTREGKTYAQELGIHGVIDKNKYAEFAVRLIGRIVFCWFLKEKKSENGIPLVPDNMLSGESTKVSGAYYHDTLEPLFFELLNTKQERRKGKFAKEEIYAQIPYLNGGLFSPHQDDHYKYAYATESGTYGLVNIPNEWFAHFYEVLSQYNFTVDENTSYDIELSIDPEMLGRIFENLLAEINPETGENAKKSTGSFYTPRDIVDYMVDNSIFEYLKGKTNIEDKRLKALISYGKEDDELAVFNKAEKKAIIKALYTVTVLDPACGSGAFPIGMLQKIVYILQEVDPEANLWFDKATENISILMKREFEKKFNAGSLDYIRKLSVIQNSIFGVDIQPIAVEIARLRCFLSLVIEETVDDNEYNRGVNPLPNLDFKFIIANTLMDLPNDTNQKYMDNATQVPMFENQDHIAELKAVREEYFSANDAETKNELKLEFAEIQKAMFQETLANRKIASRRYQELSDWAPFSNKLTNWFDPEWMFGVKEGFDILIANPPYIQLQKALPSGKKIGDDYQKCGYETFVKTGDIYCLFYERGCKLLKDNGFLIYITSNKWMRAGYGEALRAYLSKKTNPKLLIDFAGQKVFDSATVDVNILMLEKASNEGKTIACTADENCRNNMSNFVEHNSIETNFSNADNWIILSSVDANIKKKIEEKGVALKDWNIDIYRGILTGFNEAFIVSESVKNELISADPKSAELIRPILRGRDINRYCYNFANLWLINVHNGLKEKNIPPIDVNEYPAIKAHLDKYWNSLRKRCDKGDTPYNLRNCVYLDEFFKQKILFQEMIQEPSFVLDNDHHFFCLDTGRIITGSHLEYLVGLMNSKLFFYAVKKFYGGGALGSTGIRMKHTFFGEFPAIIPTNDEFDHFKKLYYSNEDRTIFDKEIVSYLYSKYKFTQEEIAVIESTYNL